MTIVGTIFCIIGIAASLAALVKGLNWLEKFICRVKCLEMEVKNSDGRADQQDKAISVIRDVSADHSQRIAETETTLQNFEAAAGFKREAAFGFPSLGFFYTKIEQPPATPSPAPRTRKCKSKSSTKLSN